MDRFKQEQPAVPVTGNHLAGLAVSTRNNAPVVGSLGIRSRSWRTFGPWSPPKTHNPVLDDEPFRHGSSP